MASRVGQQLGKYRLVRLLGREALGEVYLGEDVQYRHRVSIIVPEKHFDQNIFFELGRKLAQLTHPNIVQLQDFGVEGSWPFFLVFNHTRATSLRDRHPKGSVLLPETIVSYVKQVAAALYYAHTAQFTNLFVRPEHMFIGKNNEIVLSGFESLFADWNDENQDIGPDLAYVAPEFIKGTYIFASDQYALATVVYEWLCGTLPFTFDEDLAKFARQLRKEPPPSLREKNQSIPQAIVDVVTKALAKKPEGRFESVQHFADAFEKACLVPHVAPLHLTQFVDQQFGSYRLVKLLGQGRHGVVYLGEHTDIEKKAAIRILPPEYDTDEFHNGIQRIANLVHPHILRIRNFGIKDTRPFLEMEYAPNGTLLQRHPSGTRIELPIVVGYAKQIASALQHAHDHNMAHGFLSPADMFLGKDNEILLSGFDPFTAGQSATHQALSVGIYTPPERLSGTLLPAGDQYVLAAIVYEWLSGKLPWSNIMDGFNNPTPTPLSVYVPQLPTGVEAAVMKALSKMPKHRYSNIQDFADALDQAISPPRFSQLIAKLVGQQFGDYMLKRRLGEGGFGEIYLGQHRSLGTLAAVKVLKLDKQITEKEKKQFHNEAMALAKLTHPHVVNILHYGLQADTPYLVMDYCSSGSLRKRHPYGSRITLDVVLSYVQQIAEALQHAHNNKLIHRDVKPENVLIGQDGNLLLSDFGLAIAAHSTRSLEEQDKKGTIPYMAPEHLAGKAVAASDQYSLAIVTYELIRGARPFEGDLIQIAFQVTQANPPSLSNVSQITPYVEEVIFKALAKQPKARYPSVQAYADALKEAVEM